jgi:A/G-specific adenine glycosylase
MDWFAKQLLDWHTHHGRKDLPWQQDINPYRVWISEIMLQQTQVSTVIDYYLRFTQQFPNVTSLAQAPLDEVLHQWTGLGYYARARNLHKAAIAIVHEHAGEFPEDQAALEALPGIGRSTAAAIRSISMHQAATILDGNVKRVLSRFHAVPGHPGKTAVANVLWDLAASHTPTSQNGTYTQAIMDLGATVCVRRKPQCNLCPLQSKCEARANGDVERFPEPKPKTVKPVRQARFFVVTLPNNAALLEQRPLQGLWGGLWTPPERAADLATEQFADEIGILTRDIRAQHHAPKFRHTFTHFHLDIEPVYLQIATEPAMVEADSRWLWVHPEQLTGSNNKIGLSAPAVKLLASLTSADSLAESPSSKEQLT